MPLIHFELPLPPSVNTLYPTSWKSGLRFKSGTYKNWEKEAGLILSGQIRLLKDFSIPEKVPWKVYWEMTFERSHFNKCDCCNFTKALHDLLGRVLGIDDRYLHFYSVEKKSGEKDKVIGELSF